MTFRGPVGPGIFKIKIVPPLYGFVCYPVQVFCFQYLPAIDVHLVYFQKFPLNIERLKIGNEFPKIGIIINSGNNLGQTEHSGVRQNP